MFEVAVELVDEDMEFGWLALRGVAFGVVREDWRLVFRVLGVGVRVRGGRVHWS